MIDRRTFGLGLGGLALAGSSAVRAAASPLNGLEKEAANPMEEWLAAVEAVKQPLGALKLFRFSDGVYALIDPIGWKPPAGMAGHRPVSVPAGFVTDFASIPRIFWTLLPRDGKYTYAAVIHDYLYWSQDRSRGDADEILKIGMREFGVDEVTVNAIYWPVVAAGGWAWNANAREKAKGQKRVLRKVPNDPLQSWASWSRRADAF